MDGVNKVILVGRLTKDPVLHYTASGNAIASMNIATSESWRKDGEKHEKTEFHRVVTFSRLAEVCGQYLKKGSPVYMEGKLTTRKWQHKDGSDRWSTEVNVSNMQMLPDSRGSNNVGNSNQAPPPQQAQESPLDDGFDDIPF